MWPFKPKAAPPVPKVGERWTLSEDDSPWPKESKIFVKILDCGGGWVRYYHSPSFPDERMRISNFTAIYRLIPGDHT